MPHMLLYGSYVYLLTWQAHTDLYNASPIPSPQVLSSPLHSQILSNNGRLLKREKKKKKKNLLFPLTNIFEISSGSESRRC